ncbi:mucolipin-3-like [Amphiura filiformis]|uniref:mucolipin-3-like n=1 Tax=Amphiura filiformis TaxID=82378 RepID=UPI003B224286
MSSAVARRAAVSHSIDRDRSGSEVSREGLGSAKVDYQPSNSTNMRNNLTSGDPNGISIQRDDSEEMSQEIRTDSAYSNCYTPPQVENMMQRELKYFFMNPYEKYKARGRKPLKLCIQILKIVLVTTQLVVFGTNQFSVVTFMEENTKAFEHIFLPDWQSAFDSGVYPNTKSQYALYETDGFFEHVDYVVKQYSNLNTVAIGTYVLPPEPERQILVYTEEYTKFDVVTEYNCYDLDLKIVKSKLPQYHSRKTYIDVTTNMTGFHLKDFMEEQNHTIKFDRLKFMSLNFTINSVHVKNSKSLSDPDCVEFHVKIHYDNTPHSGRIAVKLLADDKIDENCTKHTRSHISDLDDYGWRTAVTGLDVIIIILCLVSSILCSRSLYNGYLLKKKTINFFDRHYQKKLSRSEKMTFLNLWYVMIIISDVLTLAGTVAKILIQEQKYSDYDTVSLLLGAGCFLVWFGIIRYLGFFHSYSIPVITLKVAMPNVMRFLICASIMYLAYAFCGWVVLGPYHKKFRTMGITIACMFSLINGDDMFATFEAMSETNKRIYYFSQLYLYSFISLFIYVVLSLFIAVIMDTYETVKEFHERGECENDLQVFIKQCDDTPDSGCFRVETESATRKFLRRCCKRNNQPNEYTPLMD